MAELITVAGVAITVPMVLSASWTVLKAAYGLYGNVDMRRKQIGLLLDRCRDIIEKLSQRAKDNPNTLSSSLQEHVADLQRACEEVYTIVEKLKRKGFFWCLVNQEKIDLQVADAERRVTFTFDVFNFDTQLDRDKLDQEMKQARQSDQNQLMSKLDDLSRNDERILNALQDQGGAQRRVEELLVAVYKCIQGRESDASPKTNFLRSANNALQRRSGKFSQSLQIISEEWMVTSLEVDFDTTDAIGQGSFGRVYTGQWNAVLVAVKQMYHDDARTLLDDDRKKCKLYTISNSAQAMYKEVKLWTSFHHPNILRLYGACLEASLPFLIMQYCPLGNLLNYLKSNPNANRIDLSYDIVAGMSYLHNTRNVVHADLKGLNVLVDDHKALVADFGLSQTIDGVRSRSGSTSRAGPRGTLRWMAPECHDGEAPTRASDIYSLGITIWECFSEEVPFAKYNERVLPRFVVDKQERPSRPMRMEEDAVWTVVKRCWEAEPATRPTIDRVQNSLLRLTTRLGPLGRRNMRTAWDPHSVTAALRTRPVEGVNAASEPVIKRSASSRLQQTWAQSLHLAEPTWKRGNPSIYIDELTIPLLPSDKQYQYRVVKGDTDLGIKETYPREIGGSQRINLLEYNEGYGIQDTVPIKVYAVDPEEEEGNRETLVASWSKSKRR
ncbi:kinase-like protein [Schizopora paradoxa]|uniref:Kinase-like protein n=1 Tax=Schizopora paradoxa TaxID=27342 RepID=A0A0H2SFW9_9AGAM|nr:kinase-like protein [Schizopora paradoxa]